MREVFWEAIGFSQKQAMKRTREFLERVELVLGDPAQNIVEEGILKIVQQRLLDLRKLLL